MIGRQVGAAHPNASLEVLAGAILERFRTDGTWIMVGDEAAGFSIRRAKISQASLEKGLAEVAPQLKMARQVSGSRVG